tara:strand:- start:226 stop:513 length:288 start_codon:yes stop_codon:yes gene_type:complete
MPFIQYQDKQRKSPHTLSTATRLANKLRESRMIDVYVVGKRIQGDYWIGVMTENDFFPYTRLKLSDKFHDILRIRRYKFDGWVRDPNQGVKQDDR